VSDSPAFASPAGPTPRPAIPPTAWWALRTFGPIAALLIVPTAGTIYATVGHFGREAATATSATASLDSDATDDEADDAPATKPAKGAKGSKGAKGTKRSSTKPTNGKAARPASNAPSTDSPKLCCAKLRDLGKVGPNDARPSYLTAASLCDTTPDKDRALERVASHLGVAGLDVPPECER
jgi:hypothetical protein